MASVPLTVEPADGAEDREPLAGAALADTPARAAGTPEASAQPPPHAPLLVDPAGRPLSTLRPAGDAAPLERAPARDRQATPTSAGDDPDATWITSSRPSLRALRAHGAVPAPGRQAPLSAPSVPLPPGAGALGSGHAPFDVSQLDRSLLSAVVAAAAVAALALAGRRHRMLPAVTPAGLCGSRPPFTPD